MANKRIVELSEVTNVDDKDHRFIAIDGDGNGSSTNTTDKITIDNLRKKIQALLDTIDASQIADGSVSNEEFQRLNGVTSAIQTQLDAKIGKMQANGGQAVISKSDGSIEETQVSSTELNYLSGVTSGIQGQLNNKSNTNHTHTEADITNLDKYSQAEVNSLISSHKMQIPGEEGGKLAGDFVSAVGQSSALSNTFTINVNVPAGCFIIGCNLRVDVELNRNWDAKYDDGGTFTQTIATNQSKSQNTKVDKMYDIHSDSNIPTNEVDIKITSNDGNAFDNNGKIRAIVYYIKLFSMGNVGA